MSDDWVKAYRSMMDSAVWDDEWLVKLWLWCLFKANHRDGIFKGKPIKRGQFVTGRNRASDELGVSPSRWYRGIQRLIDLGNITIESNSEWTMITVCNYSTYQDKKEVNRTANEQPADSQRTASDTTSGQPADTIEECKNIRMEEGKNGREEKTARKRAVSRPPEEPPDEFPEPLNNERFKESWNEWVKYRQELRKPLTETSKKQQIKKMAAMGMVRAIAMVEHTIAMGWQGLREPERGTANGKPRRQYVLTKQDIEDVNAGRTTFDDYPPPGWTG